MKQMTICMVLPVLVTKNGTAKQCVELSRALQKLGHNVYIVTFAYCPATADQQYAAVNVLSLIRLPSLITRFPIRIFTLEKYLLYIAMISSPLVRLLLNRHHPDVLQSHDWLSMWMIAPLKNLQYKLIATINDVPQRTGTSWMQRWKLTQDKKFARHIDAFTVLDKWNEKRLVAWIPGSKSRIRIIRSGIAPERYGNFHATLSVRRACHITKNSLVLVCANILSPHRRYEQVIEAVGILRKHSYDVHLVILSKRDADRSYAGKLDMLIQKLHLSPYVHFIDRFFTDEERMSYIQTSDILIFPNYPQTWGLTALEAMALGIPVIVSDGSGVAEILADKQNALRYQAGNISQLVTCLEYLLKTSTKRTQIAKAGQKFVLSKYTWNNYARQMENIYS